MKMAKYRKIRYRSRFRPSCHFRDGQYRLQNNTNLLAAGQGDRPSKCRFSHPMALIFLKPPSFSSTSSLHQRNRDRHDHHDGTAAVEHCHLWAVQLTVEEGAKMVLNTMMGISRRMHMQ